jgi:hypothetical protein
MRQEKSAQYWFCDAMEPEQQITAEDILWRQSPRRVPDISLATLPARQTPTAAKIIESIRQRFAQSPDAGVLKRLANVALDPPNPFNPNARRQPRQDAVILGALILVELALVFYFNITSVVG